MPVLAHVIQGAGFRQGRCSILPAPNTSWREPRNRSGLHERSIHEKWRDAYLEIVADGVDPIRTLAQLAEYFGMVFEEPPGVTPSAVRHAHVYPCGTNRQGFVFRICGGEACAATATMAITICLKISQFRH